MSVHLFRCAFPLLLHNALLALVSNTHFRIFSRVTLNPTARPCCSCAAALGDDPRDEARQLAAVDATSHFAAASRSNLALVLQDPLLTRSWLTLPARINQKAAVLHSVATVLAPLDTGPALPQPPNHPENPAFAAADVAQPPDVASAAATAAEAAATAREVIAAPGSQPQQQPASAAAAEAAKKLFDELGRANAEASTMALLMQLLRSPIEELRHGAYDVLRGAAACPPSVSDYDGELEPCSSSAIPILACLLIVPT